MNQSINTKVEKNIRKLYLENPIAKKFLDWCAERQRDARETSIDRITTITGGARSEAVNLAKQMEEAGCGEFIVGRRGASSRFAWSHSRISLGRVALGEADEVEEWVNPMQEDEDVTEIENSVSLPQDLTIPAAKAILAASLGLEPSQIEINIRA